MGKITVISGDFKDDMEFDGNFFVFYKDGALSNDSLPASCLERIEIVNKKDFEGASVLLLIIAGVIAGILGEAEMFLLSGFVVIVWILCVSFSDQQTVKLVFYLCDGRIFKGKTDDLTLSFISKSIEKNNDNIDTDLYKEAIAYVRNGKSVSVSLMQKKFDINLDKAAILINKMEKDGIVGPAIGSAPRAVLGQQESMSE